MNSLFFKGSKDIEASGIASFQLRQRPKIGSFSETQSEEIIVNSLRLLLRTEIGIELLQGLMLQKFYQLILRKLPLDIGVMKKIYQMKLVQF